MALHISELFSDDCNMYSLPEPCTVHNNNQMTTSLKMLEITTHTLSLLDGSSERVTFGVYELACPAIIRCNIVLFCLKATNVRKVPIQLNNILIFLRPFMDGLMREIQWKLFQISTIELMAEDSIAVEA